MSARSRKPLVSASLTALLLVTVVSGCPCRKPKTPPPPPVYPLCIEASPKLNWYNDRSHTLYMRVFQLSSIDSFKQADAGKLLDPQFMLPGVQGAPIEKTVYPDTKTTLEVRQHPEALFLGIVTGYYRLEGAAKAQRTMVDPVKPEGCLLLGPNGVER